MSFLYLLKCSDFYKIGISNDINSRLAQLQTGNPLAIEVSGVWQFENAVPVESSLHQTFLSFRGIGEWFKLNNVDVTRIFKICELLGGENVRHQFDAFADSSEVNEVDQYDDSANDTKTDFQKMISDGWRIEVTQNGRYWHWRRGSKENREQVRGGKFEVLPQEYKDAYYRNRDRRNGLIASEDAK